jgi:hypothetical protein
MMLKTSPLGGTYAARIRDVMAEQRISIRDLQRSTRYSYEHLRKCLAGLPVASQALNKAVCKALDLDDHELWALAVSEKAQARFGVLGVADPTASNAEIVGMWRRLTATEQGRLLRIADGWLALRETGVAK